MWWKIMGSTIIALAFVITASIRYGAQRWLSHTGELRAKMDTARVPITSQEYDARELAELPAPVQRYFQAVLKDGQPMIAAARVEHTGTFNLSDTGEKWTPFKSTQHVVTRRPGFVWDARMDMGPGMAVRVHDAYAAGQGHLTAKLFGLVTVMAQPQTPELAHGELMRFFAEAAWYPTALLPSQGVVWEAIDDTHASATLTDGPTTVKLLFQFDAQGLIGSVHSDGRYRTVDGKTVATPWRGRFWDYQVRDGMLIPLEGEVAWLLSEGPLPYWRGRIQRVEFEYVQ